MKSAEERLLEVSSEALDGRPRGLIEFARDELVLLRELVVVVEAGGEGEWVAVMVVVVVVQYWFTVAVVRA